MLGGLRKMPTLGFGTKKPTNTKHTEECVLLIEGEANDAAKISNELNSATDDRFDVEWVSELSSAIERLRNGGVGAVVLDLTLADSHGIETFNKVFLRRLQKRIRLNDPVALHRNFLQQKAYGH